MLIMTQDRISGLAALKSPLKTFGPGNTQDDSNRNSWVSSEDSDTVTIDCFGQVNGLFMGRYRADKILLTYQGDNLFANKTASGSVSIGYSEVVSGSTNNYLTSDSFTVSAFEGDFFTNPNIGTNSSILNISLNTLDSINVGDFIQISTSGSYSKLNGPHRIVEVKDGQLITKLNSSGNSVFRNDSSADSTKSIKIVLNDNQADANSEISALSSSLQVRSGITIPIISAVVENENDVNFTYEVKFSIADESLLGSGEVPFNLNEFISFENVSILKSDGTTFVNLSENYNKYYVVRKDEVSRTFSIFLKVDSFLGLNELQSQLTIGTNARANFGTSFVYNGGGFQHRLGLSLVEGSTLTGDDVEFTNNEKIELSSPSISSISFSGNGIDQLKLNDPDQSFLHPATIKDRFTFSIRLPYYFKDNSGQKSFTFGSSDSIEIRKYILDTSEASTTTTGAGTAIRKAEVSTRTQTSISNFVQGKLTRVSSNYIPLPREAFPTRIKVDFDSTLNHNASGLFNQFLLEELTFIKPNDSTAFITTSDISEYTTAQRDNVQSFTYNSNGNGLLVLKFSGTSFTDTGKISVGDHVYLNWPNNAAPYTNSSPITRESDSDTTGTLFGSKTSVHELYKGMQVQNLSNSLNDVYILSIDKIANNVVTNISHGVSGEGVNLKFLHSSTLAAEASSSWTGIHKVVAVTSDEISIYVPNAGTSGDLTLNSSVPVADRAVSGAYLSKVINGKGRFVRPIATGLTSCSHFLWNSSSSVQSYLVSGISYQVQPGTALLLFSSPHGLVNNDKIILYDVNSSLNGDTLRGLDSSYLVTYSTSNSVTINIKQASNKDVSSITGDSSNTSRLTLVTTTDHGFSVGDKVSLNQAPNSGSDVINGSYVIATVPTSKSFTIISSDSSLNLSSYSQPSSGSATYDAIVGVHKLTYGSSSVHTEYDSSSYVQNLNCSRSVSIADVTSVFENPIEVGNFVYRDGYEGSSGQYDSVVGGAVFNKTPAIDDATSTTPYRPDVDTAVQNTFLGTTNSVISQINLIRGDATSQFDIELSKPFGSLNTPIVFTKLLQGLKAAIIRAGISESLPNPQIGVSNNRKDYSVRKELPTGAYYYLNRDSAQEFSGNLISDPENINKLVDFGAEQLARPFPCLIISGNSGNIKKLRTRTALYGYFTALPQSTFNNKLNNLKQASFSIREVL